MQPRTIHLLANAHIDPVWLWDWREGGAEAVSTCRTMVELMRRNPEMTFIRGEAWAYEQLERCDPALFAAIRELVAAGRWDVVGGNYVQSDTNLPGTATFLQQFEVGQRYFQEKFGRRVEAAWSADSFGQSRGLPEVFAASGLKYFAFGRPEAWIYPMRRPLFFWRGAGGSELLCYRIPLDWYASERGGLQLRLDEYLARMPEWDLEHVALFFGLGDHGGGASQRMLDDVAAWRAAHPEVEVKFSTLHGYFAAAEAEVRRRGRDLLDTIDDEINFLQRGYYASCAKIKFPFRAAEAAVRRAALTTRISAAVRAVPPPEMTTEWQGLLFNAFHDILPGTSIERACDEQRQWLGGVLHRSRELEIRALEPLFAQIDTRVKPVAGDFPEAVPFVVFNPRPAVYRGAVELEASLDYRPIWAYERRAAELPVELLDETGAPVAFQTVETEHNFLPGLPWRRRLVFTAEIPPLGWRKFTVGYVEQPLTAARPATAPRAAAPEPGVLTNARYRVETQLGRPEILIWRDGRELFGGAGLRFETCRDVWGSWGSIQEDSEAFLCAEPLERWPLLACSLLESGPERAALWLKFGGAKSQVEAVVRLEAERDAVDLELRILWNERGSRLRVLTAPADRVTYAVAGGAVERGAAVVGDVPGGRWLIWHKADAAVGWITDHLCGYGNYADAFGATLIRGNLYCTSDPVEPDQLPHRPANDQGEHRCRLTITGAAARSAVLAGELELPVRAFLCDRHAGPWPGRGSWLAVEPETVEVLDIAECDGKLTLTLQAPETLEARIRYFDGSAETVTLPAWRIVRHTKQEKVR